MTETKLWSFRIEEGNYILDLIWTGKGVQDVIIGEYKYGGMFLRMPWTPEINGYAMNNDGLQGEKAEGKNAKWVDIAMQVKGRENLAHIVMMDHPDNPGYPSKWRIDNKLGVGPCYARSGEWNIAKGSSISFKHRLLVYTGKQNKKLHKKCWSDHIK